MTQTILLKLDIYHILFFLFTFIIMEAVCIYLWKYRRVTGALPLLFCQISRAAWVAATIFKHLSSDLHTALFWQAVTDYAGILTGYFWCVFAVKISWQQNKPPLILWIMVQSLVGVELLTVVIDRGQYIVKAWIESGKLTIIFGGGCLLVFVCAYAMILLATLLLLYFAWRSYGWHRKMLFLLSLAPLITIVGHIVSFIPGAFCYMPLVVASLLAQMYAVYLFYRWRLFSVLPLAQEAVVENIIDGLLVIDEKDNIVAMNPAAAEILQGLPGKVGGTFQELAAAWPVLQEIIDAPDGAAARSGYREHAAGRRYYQFHVISLQARKSHSLGKTIIIKDITGQKQAQDKIIDQQKAMAVLKERKRLGREMHDGEGQIWSYLLVELQTLRMLLSNGQIQAAEQYVDRLNDIIRDCNNDVRESIAGLKQENPQNGNFLSKLEEYCRWYEKTYGIVVVFQVPENGEKLCWTEAAKVQVPRIIQEALTNVRKHAQATQVVVKIVSDNGMLEVILEDDGCGFSQEMKGAGRYGLSIMQERAEEAGGSLMVESMPGKGTKLTMRFVEEKTDES